MKLLSGLRRVVVGMSGGVDSTVSALLLKNKGYEVVGVFMKNWDGVDETGVCTADQDQEAAADTAKQLGIKFTTVNLVKQYWNEVFNELVEDYSRGLTPNPDILCNSRVKFTHFYEHAINVIGCDAIATGHYARNSYGPDLELRHSNQRAQLLKSIDRVKDQTFFLSQIPQNALQRTMFPVGDLTKDVVKKIAAQAGFPQIASKKESMGICFVGKKSAPGKRGFQEFIAEYVADKFGEFVDIDTGERVGTHKGIHQWTLGQRTRVKKNDQSYFVVSKNPENQEIVVAGGIDHPALFCDNFYTDSPHWIAGAPGGIRSGRNVDCEFRFQNMQPLSQCNIQCSMTSSPSGNWEEISTEGGLVVCVAEPMRAVSPGQFSVFYQADVCLGSARITRPGPSLYSLHTGRHRIGVK